MPKPSRALLTMARRKRGRQGVKIHRSYSVDEAARAVGVAKITVRRWIKGGLPTLMDRKPQLILGADLAQFLTKSKTSSQPCQPFQCYCVKCRKPQKPAGKMAEFVLLTPVIGNLRGICPTCGTLMHKRMKRTALEAIGGILDVTFAQAIRHLSEPTSLSPNDALPMERQTDA
jgi:DNA-binding XRE family transcriptional regulator